MPAADGRVSRSGSRCSPRNWSASALALADQPGVGCPLTITSAAPAARVVVARHAHRVGAGREDGDEVARRAPRACGRGRASRPIRRSGRRRRRRLRARRGARSHSTMPHPGAVHRRPRQVVHRRIDDAEVLARARLQVQHLADQDAGIADQRAAGLEQELATAVAARVDALEQRGDQRLRRRAASRRRRRCRGRRRGRDARWRCLRPRASRPGRAGGRAHRGRARSR